MFQGASGRHVPFSGVTNTSGNVEHTGKHSSTKVDLPTKDVTVLRIIVIIKNEMLM